MSKIESRAIRNGLNIQATPMVIFISILLLSVKTCQEYADVQSSFANPSLMAKQVLFPHQYIKKALF
jgi:hypothetical protein